MAVIGIISSGKSTFLNSIFGFNYLQVNSNITTKFICVIRYNPNIKEPIFYHLKLIPKKNKPDEYMYMCIKNEPKIMGKKIIKEKIISINKELHNSCEPKYEDLFWMLETNKILIENKNFMENTDFYDIPGLNEYLKTNEKTQQSNLKEKDNIQSENDESDLIDNAPPPTINMIEDNINEIDKKDINANTKISKEEKDNNYKYIHSIFKYLKTKIKNFIFIISTESCYKPENLEIIENIRKNIDFDLEGGLFVLTKIDKSENKEKKIFECNQYFINNMPSDIFNLHFNIFVAINSKNFKNEMFMKDKIKYYFLYFYNKYYDNYIKISNEKHKNKNFISFIEEDIIKKEIGENNFEDFIEKASDEIKMEDLNKIKKVYELIKLNENIRIEFGINFDDEDDDSIKMLKGLYQLFKEKKYVPPYSESTKIILNFFNDYDKETPLINKDKVKNKQKDKIDINLENLENIFNGIKLCIKDDKKDYISFIKQIDSKLETIEKYVKNGKNIYIPFIGPSNAGKSTILNCLIGNKLFEESDSECTRRGIIIEYGEEVELYEVKVIKIEVKTKQNYYYVFEKDRLISRTVDKVKEYLKCLNFQYGEDESKYFYIIKTPIKFFDDYEFSEELKRSIFFIDLPGFDTSKNMFNSQNERSVYEKLLEISSSFIFINRNRAITDIKNNKLLKKAYEITFDNSSLNLNNCLFLLNMDSKLSDDDKNIIKIQEDFSNIIFDEEDKLKRINLDKINAQLFDAKSYMEYLDEYNELGNTKYLFNKFKIYFLKKKKKNNFIKFCLSSIKAKFKDLSMEYDKNYESDNLFYEIVKNEIILIMNELNQKYNDSDLQNIKEISNILQYMNKKMKENKFYKNSNCEDFFKTLKNQIIKAKNYVEENFKINLVKCFFYFDMVFNREINLDNSINLQNLREESNKIIEELKVFESKYKFEQIFDKYNIKIIKLFENIAENKQKYISKYNKDLEKLIKKELEEKINYIFKEELDNEIENFMKELDEELDKNRKNLEKIFKIGLKDEIKKGKYKSQLEAIFKFSFCEKLKLKICEAFGNKYTPFFASVGVFALFIGFHIIAFNFIGIITGLASFIVFGITSWLISKFKNKEKLLSEKLESCEKELNDNYSRMRIKFIRLYKDSLEETQKLFRELLSLACADLSKIEKKNWQNLKIKYQEIKNNILLLLNK